MYVRREKRQGIKVLDSWAFGSSYPTAGDPSVGFLALSVSALFVLISLLAMGVGGTQRGVIVIAAVFAVVSSLALFVKSFGELAGERSTVFLFAAYVYSMFSGGKDSQRIHV